MTYHEAALLLERIAEETHDLTSDALEALFMGSDVLEEKERNQDDGR